MLLNRLELCSASEQAAGLVVKLAHTAEGAEEICSNLAHVSRLAGAVTGDLDAPYTSRRAAVKALCAAASSAAPGLQATACKQEQQVERWHALQQLAAVLAYAAAEIRAEDAQKAAKALADVVHAACSLKSKGSDAGGSSNSGTHSTGSGWGPKSMLHQQQQQGQQGDEAVKLPVPDRQQQQQQQSWRQL
jgi:hypothetical protein